MAHLKLNFYKIVLQEVCEKFSGTEENIKKRIEEVGDEKKISAEEKSICLRITTRFVKILKASFSV